MENPEPTWPHAKQCFNCGTSVDVYKDTGLCRVCENELLAKKHIIMDRYYAETKSLYRAIRESEQNRDDAITALLDEYKIPLGFRR